MVEVVYLDPLTALYRGDCREVLASMPAESVQCCITSPPYWGLRDYKIAPMLWGGQAECPHGWGKFQQPIKPGQVPQTKTGANTIESSSASGNNASTGQFCAKCGAWQGSLGLEPSPELYVEHIVEVFQAVKRVLRKDGTVWLNMGDSYAGSNSGKGDYREKKGLQRDIYDWEHPQASVTNWDKWRRGVGGEENGVSLNNIPIPNGLKPLDLCGMPWRVAFALQADGWWLRSDIIWAKRNPMPESVSGSRWERHKVKVGAVKPETYSSQKNRQGEGIGTGWSPAHPEHGEKPTLAEWEDCPGCALCEPNDGLVLRRGAWRPTTAHEYVFMLTKSEGYYADGEAVREASTDQQGAAANFRRTTKEDINPGQSVFQHRMNRQATADNGTRNKRTVWEIASQPFAGAHFATFPEKLVEPCLLAGTSERGACPKCGMAWVRVMEKGQLLPDTPGYKPRGNQRGDNLVKNAMTPAGETQGYPNFHYEAETLGWRAACGCGDAETVPCVVLDPFAGSGTVGVVARRWGRKAILIELSEKYCKLAVERLTGAQPALGVTDA